MPRQRIFTDDEKRLIVKCRAEGVSIANLAHEHHCGTDAIKEVLGIEGPLCSEYGGFEISRQMARRKRDALAPKVCAAYRNGASIQKIADDMGIGYATTHTILVENHVDIKRNPYANPLPCRMVRKGIARAQDAADTESIFYDAAFITDIMPRAARCDTDKMAQAGVVAQRIMEARDAIMDDLKAMYGVAYGHIHISQAFNDYMRSISDDPVHYYSTDLSSIYKGSPIYRLITKLVAAEFRGA